MCFLKAIRVDVDMTRHGCARRRFLKHHERRSLCCDFFYSSSEVTPHHPSPNMPPFTATCGGEGLKVDLMTTTLALRLSDIISRLTTSTGYWLQHRFSVKPQEDERKRRSRTAELAPSLSEFSDFFVLEYPGRMSKGCAGCSLHRCLLLHEPVC
jgi:hypothetical protein